MTRPRGGLGGDPALRRLARIVHAADTAQDLHSDPLGPGCWRPARAAWIASSQTVKSS
jgi:hypothetical protein